MKLVHKLLLCIVLFSVLVGCASTGLSTKAQKPQQPVPEEYLGDWVFSMLYDQRGSLQVTQDRIVLSLSGAQGYGLVEVVYVGKTPQGFDEFRFVEGNLNNRRRPSRMWRDYSIVDGFILYDPYRDPRISKKRYTFLFSQKGKTLMGYQGDIHPLKTQNTAGRVGISASTSSGYYLYNDGIVRNRRDDRFRMTLDFYRYNDILKQTVNSTLHSGFNCGNVVNTVVKPGYIRRIKLPADYSGTLIKIVSPLGSNRLIYGIGSTTASYGRVNTPSRGFPTILARNFTGRPFVDLLVLPEVRDDYYKQAEIPVSLYYFNSRLIVDRNSCEYLKTSTFQKSLAVAKVYFAILMENTREEGARENSDIKEYIGIYGRDASLDSALRDIFPAADDATIAYMTRNIGNIMQNGLSPKDMAMANLRETVLQDIESRPGMKGYGLRYWDILLDTSSFNKSMSGVLK